MAAPYFQEADRIKKFGVHTFSSNYHLYGDLSWRVMETMRSLLPPGQVEVYSVDEAFIDLHHSAEKEVYDFCIHLKNTIETWTGISVSIGAAPNKVLSKVANRLAKKNKIQTNCVVVLDSTQKIQNALQKTPIEDVWGIGYKYSEKLKVYGINTAFALSMKDLSWGKKFLGGITGIKLIRELIRTNTAYKDIYHHLLGASDWKEFQAYTEFDWIKSMDTSAPIINGALGIKFNHEETYAKPTEKLEHIIERDLTNKMDIIQHNINMFRKSIIEN
jgi:hypothetical protein